MASVTNRARQLLLLREALSKYSGKTMSNAIEAIASDGGQRTRLYDRLTAMVVNLPSDVVMQSREVLGQTASTYAHDLDRVVDHFRASSLGATIDQWLQIFDRPAELALNAIADLLDKEFSTTTVDAEKVTDLASTVESLIDEIKSDETLDDDTRTYLLEVALHLLQILQRLDLFGTEGLVDLQGQFISTLWNLHPDLVPNTEVGAPDSSGPRLTDRIWEAIVAATVITGLPANALSIAGVVVQALHSGGH